MSWRRTTVVGLALLLWLAPAQPTTAQTLGRVCAIELRLDTPLGRNVDLESLMAFRPGVALTEPAIRRTLSNVMATGLVDEAEVHSRPCSAPEGATAGEGPSAPRWVTVVVMLRARPWVETVELVGRPKLRPTILKRAIEQPDSAPLSEEQVLRSHYALQKLYADNGYRQARVRLEVVPDPFGGRRVLRFHLDPGERFVLGEVRLSGELGDLDHKALLAENHSRPGRPYTRSRALADVDRLREALADRGYLQARAQPPIDIEDPESHRVHLVFPLDMGRPMEVEVVGATERKLRKLGLLRFLRDPSLDPTLIDQSCQRIADHYQRRGYFLADVQCQEAPGQEALGQESRRLRIAIEPGEKMLLETIDFSGNERIEDDALRTFMGTGVARRFRPGSGRLVDLDLEKDLANLRSYYLLEGFLDAEVGTPRIDRDGNHLALEIPIHEGERRRVVELSWIGNRNLDADTLSDTIPLRSGGPYHPVLLEETVNNLRTVYEDRGFRDVTIEPRLDWNETGTLVDIDLVIHEGQRSELDRVILRGHHHTRPQVIRRTLGFEGGDVISRRRLLEAERDLYRLGIFSRVDVDFAPSSDLGPRRDVVVRLEEGSRWRLGYGVSYHSDDGLGGLFSVVRNNLRGRGDRFQLDARGNQAERRFRLILDQPSLFSTNVPITFILFRQEERRPLFQVNDTGAQISLSKELGSLRLGVLYDYRRVGLLTDAVDFADLDLIDLDREDREVELSSLTPNLFIDRRDDPLDPRDGWSTNLQLELAFPFLDAEANFLKLFWQQTHYRTLGRFGGLAFSLRLGAIEGLDDTLEPDPLVPPALPSARIPVSERFFAGGRTSHRAYERDQLGVRDGTLVPLEGGGLVEVGGNGLFVLNLDYRFPISGDFGGTFFFDLGNVWADWRDFDVDQLRPGAGLGLRYASPIGPIRFEMGWKLDRQDFEESGPVLFLSFGNPF